MTAQPETAFDFGENWSEFSARALDAGKVAQACAQFAALTSGIVLPGRSFLDIGFGQGLGLLAAAALGATASGCDINPKCAAVLRRNLPYFPELSAAPPVVVGSILDPAVVASLRDASPERRGYDVVHSWGVLHHTGDMPRAIAHAAGLVAPGGHLVMAIYNRHWSSPAWHAIKWLYVRSPRWAQRAFVGLLYPVIYAAKWIVTGRNPKVQERGMDFYFDVVDWVGGYPYDYASAGEMERLLAGLGFHLVRFHAARVPTGCNEFIFVHGPAPAR
jgi:2-polyprenyl-6-hydroxyphenyl methylase/3-demethylubiquinone-9 3-methyltransferase